jgi:hypothetical protein
LFWPHFLHTQKSGVFPVATGGSLARSPAAAGGPAFAAFAKWRFISAKSFSDFLSGAPHTAINAKMPKKKHSQNHAVDEYPFSTATHLPKNEHIRQPIIV